MFRAALEVDEQRQAVLMGSTRALARAEFVQWSEVLAASDQLNAEVDREDDYFRRIVRVRSQTPNTWVAFRDGRVDGARVREISRAVEQLKLPESHARLDRVGLAYAETHTVAEVRAWLKRFVARVEPEGFNARADDERRQRRVEVMFGEDGMGWLNAYLPNFELAAIDNRLEARAKEIALHADPEDTRTKAQRRADVFGEWLLSAQHAPASLAIDVAVTVPVTALTGSSGLPTESADGQWGIPTAWAHDQYVRQSTFWHRIVVDPVSNDVLAHDYLGRYAPDVLARALIFRDQTCKAPGCCTPAARCDMDHRTPWPDGPTSGDNMWALCRRHHNQKGRGVLRWQTPDGRTIPVEKADLALSA